MRKKDKLVLLEFAKTIEKLEKLENDFYFEGDKEMAMRISILADMGFDILQRIIARGKLNWKDLAMMQDFRQAIKNTA